MSRRLACFGLSVAVWIGSSVGATGPVGAQVYRWTDESGQTHITDDPNQVPDSRRPKPPPPAPRTAARVAVEALRSLDSLVRDDPALDAYAEGVARATRAVGDATAAMDRGPLRSALGGALACYREAADLWSNQVAVRRGLSVALNMAPIRRGWECGAQRTAEAERLLAARP